MSMLPELTNRVYPLKLKKRDEPVFPTKRVDIESEIQKLAFALAKPSTSQSINRNALANQAAARYFDKRAIQQRIDNRIRQSSGMNGEIDCASSSGGVGGGGIESNYQKINSGLQSQNINMKIVTDNVSRNILVYVPKLDGREKFQTKSVYPDSLKQIDRKIQKYKRALEEAIKQQEFVSKEKYIVEFDVLPLDQPPAEENFDFLTGIGLHKQNESPQAKEQEQQPNVEETRDPVQEPLLENPYQHQFESVRKAFSHIYEQYQNKISKAFIKKDQPKARVRRKNPKINITGKANKVKRTGLPFDEVEHLMRVYNKEHIPCQPTILVPSFQQKKDNIANTVLAYLKDYKPLLSGNKANIPKSIQGLLDVELDILKTNHQEEADNNNRDRTGKIPVLENMTSSGHIKQNLDINVNGSKSNIFLQNGNSIGKYSNFKRHQQQEQKRNNYPAQTNQFHISQDISPSPLSIARNLNGNIIDSRKDSQDIVQQQQHTISPPNSSFIKS